MPARCETERMTLWLRSSDEGDYELGDQLRVRSGAGSGHGRASLATRLRELQAALHPHGHRGTAGRIEGAELGTVENDLREVGWQRRVKP